MTVTELLDELGVKYVTEGQHHHVGNGWIGLDCPRCSPGSQRYRLGVPVDSRGAGNCWTCGPVRLYEVLREVIGPAGNSRLSALYATFSHSGGINPSGGADRGRKGPLNAKLTLPAGIGPLLPAHRRYLRARGFNPKTIERLWGVRGIGVAPRLQWRLFIPVRQGTETVSWTTRSISDECEVPYLTAKPEEEKVHIRDTLYGVENARHTIVVCEGPLDSWAVGPGGVSTCGVGYSPAQVLVMSRFPVRVVLFDGERDAQRRAKGLCRLLRLYEGNTVNVTLDTGKDASRASRQELRQLREKFLL